MNENSVKNILLNINLSYDQIIEFIIDYVKMQTNENIDFKKAEKILLLCKSGYFNLRFAALEAAKKLDLKVRVLKDEYDNIIKTYVD